MAESVTTLLGRTETLFHVKCVFTCNIESDDSTKKETTPHHEYRQKPSHTTIENT